MEISDFIVRILVALSCGFVIGFERQFRNKDAGLRTNALVAVGAAIYVLLSLKLTGPEGDVTRIISQVVTGIGFLGAGVIFKTGLNVHGLTSAASIWCSAAVACLAAAGYYTEAALCTFIVVFVNSGLIPLDKWLRTRKERNE
mgnify:CR=1 FL=1